MTVASCLTSAVAEAVRATVTSDNCMADCIKAVRHAVSAAVVEGYDLDAMWRESDPDKRLPGRYRRHQVVTDEELGFTVVVLLWEPGAVTAIHDHDTWCVFGMLEGELEVTDYDHIGDLDDDTLNVRETKRYTLGTSTMGDNGDPAGEIHRVRNTGLARAISLHIYGSDLTKRSPFEGRKVAVDGKQGCLGFTGMPAY
jgi:predicted metal-dependent enzyme (double-stranded beta helix superfamily)